MPDGAGAAGDGYGDGRAISLAEVVVPSSGRWELQLKGAGTTPFARRGDGRAVLRSSAREFLGSEALFHLGVPTTRALSLVASGSEAVWRPWYSNSSGADAGAGARHGGDVMQAERAAITCRVARSFARVGHFELFGRRARRGDAAARAQLEALFAHVARREFADEPGVIAPARAPLSTRVLALAGAAARRARARASRAALSLIHI